MHVDSEARRIARTTLGLEGRPRAPFLVRYRDADYGVVAFHGHEIDLMNFGGQIWEAGAYDKEGYSSPSVGEAITIEIVGRLPMIAMKELNRMAQPQVDRIVRILQDIDNIRPVTAIFRWLKEETAGLPKGVVRMLDDVASRIFVDFSKIAFVREWSERIDQRFIPEDAPWLVRRWAQVMDKDFHEWIRGIKSVREASDMLEREAAAGVDAYDRIKELSRHRFRAEVLDKDFDSLRSRADKRYYVYGHTHVPMIAPLVGGVREHLLVNTGTFRPRFVAAGDRSAVGGFVGQRTMSFAVIFREGELSSAGNQKRYELWSGLSER
jgi:hypothetical protein